MTPRDLTILLRIFNKTVILYTRGGLNSDKGAMGIDFRFLYENGEEQPKNHAVIENFKQFFHCDDFQAIAIVMMKFSDFHCFFFLPVSPDI